MTSTSTIVGATRGRGSVLGLGGAVAELLALEHPTPMRMIGMPDEFAVVGPTLKVRERYGMSAEAIVDACTQLLER